MTLRLVSKSTSTTYEFRGDFGWANCTVNDATGELGIQSDWGTWSHRWSPNPEHLGAPSLTAFIGTRGDVDYIARKLQHEGRDGRRWSATKTARELQRRLCQRRLEQGRRDTQNRTMFPYPSRHDARHVWDLIESTAHDVPGGDAGAHLFYERLLRDEGFTDFVTTEPWEYSQTEPTPEDVVLRQLVLPALIEACRTGAAAAAPQSASVEMTPECPGPDCLMCNGAACNLCGAGCWNNSAPHCDHASDERHHAPGSEPWSPQ
jgi:hypothetical protein